MLALTLSHLEILSDLESLGKSENEIYLTGEMFSDACHLFAILYERENLERSADDLQAQLYDHFKGELRFII